MKMAVARPAAPAPTTATSAFGSEIRRAVYAAAVSLTGTVEIAPHVLPRPVCFVGSSVLPITWVRWLPHLGQTGGVVVEGRCRSEEHTSELQSRFGISS